MSARATRRRAPGLPPELRHQRERIAALVTVLVDLLDALDRDPDAEPDHDGADGGDAELSLVLPFDVRAVGAAVPALLFARAKPTTSPTKLRKQPMSPGQATENVVRTGLAQ